MSSISQVPAVLPSTYSHRIVGGLAPRATESADTGITSQSDAKPASTAAQTDADLRLQQKLAARDREVRAHEAAHQAVGGRYAAGAKYTYQRGPNGQLYAVGGSVQIDTASIPGDPQATLEKAEVVRRAALAPAQPSGPDRQIAMQAVRMAAEARAELAKQHSESDTTRGQAGAAQYQRVASFGEERVDNAATGSVLAVAV